MRVYLRDKLSRAQDLHSLQSGKVAHRANESTSLYLLPQLILIFRQQCPKTDRVFRHVSTRLPHELRQRIWTSQFLSFLPEYPYLETADMLDDLVIASPEHRLASVARVHVKDLGGDAVIATRAVAFTQKVIGLSSFSAPLKSRLRRATIETVKKFVA